MQYDAVVANRPALLPVDEVDGGEVGAHRNCGLLPGYPAIARHEDLPALSDGHQAIPAAYDRLHEALCRKRSRLRRCVEHVDEAACGGERRERRDREEK